MNRKGFTLIEVLLALFITAILIMILSIVFNTGLRSYRQGKDLLEMTRKGQLILGQMTRELVGAMVQEGIIPFVGNRNSIYFMAPAENSSPVDLCEIGYNLVGGGVLKRHFITANSEDKYQYPDSRVEYGESEDEFCDMVTGFNLGFHDGSGWSEDAWGEQYKLPTMVEVSVTIEGKYPGNKPKQFTTWIYLPNSTNNP